MGAGTVGPGAARRRMRRAIPATRAPGGLNAGAPHAYMAVMNHPADRTSPTPMPPRPIPPRPMPTFLPPPRPMPTRSMPSRAAVPVPSRAAVPVPVRAAVPVPVRAARALLAATALLGLAACTGDEGDIAAEREAARQVARENRGADGERLTRTAPAGHYAGVPVAELEEVADAIEAIPSVARAIRAAKRVERVELRLAPEPVVIGPGARGDLQLDNTAPLETIRNAVEGSALAHTRARAAGVFMADVVAARFEDELLTLYLVAP